MGEGTWIERDGINGVVKEVWEKPLHIYSMGL